MAKRVTPKNLPFVWLRLTAYVNATLEHQGATASFCDDLNNLLDDLSSQDAFGTEGQNDPRGDQREP